MPSVGDRPPRRLARQTLAEVVEPRYEEMFALVREELRRSGFEEMIAAGIVLTGGSAKMEGAIELAEEVFHMPVRLGMPQHITRPRRRGPQSDPLDRRRPAAVRRATNYAAPAIAARRSPATRAAWSSG